MEYSIAQAAERAHLTVHTLRYYDKEGLLPFIHRTQSGARIFTESDMEWLGLIGCLKNADFGTAKGYAARASADSPRKNEADSEQPAYRGLQDRLL